LPWPIAPMPAAVPRRRRRSSRPACARRPTDCGSRRAGVVGEPAHREARARWCGRSRCRRPGGGWPPPGCRGWPAASLKANHAVVGGAAGLSTLTLMVIGTPCSGPPACRAPAPGRAAAARRAPASCSGRTTALNAGLTASSARQRGRDLAAGDLAGANQGRQLDRVETPELGGYGRTSLAHVSCSRAAHRDSMRPAPVRDRSRRSCRTRSPDARNRVRPVGVVRAGSL
jgi:hypothetical protein